ncbi:MAG: AAA family ATPase [Patescibacteria group bacterium]
MATNLRIKSIIEKQITTGRLAHAYLFVGPRGAGKKSFVLEFAKKVIGNENLFSHPDFAFLDCQEDASADSVRDFIGRMALKPFVAKKKFAFISNIENLNIQGANALLKTLEEPAGNTVIVLTANTGNVPPTIISRCMVFAFNRMPLQKTETWTSAEDPGRPILDFAGKPLSERLLGISRFADMPDSELKQEVENFVYESANALKSDLSKYNRLAAGLKAYEDLATNKNKKLILQALMLQI